LLKGIQDSDVLVINNFTISQFILKTPTP
jgi:hypothetical protein